MTTFDDLYETLPGTGWLSKREAFLLWKYASSAYADGNILEVGCFHGRSTVLLASFGRPVFSVDPFVGFSTEDPSGEKTKVAFLENTKRFPNVLLWQMRVEDFPTTPIGLAYLDGDHSLQGTRRQIEKAIQCGASVIAIHDVNDSGEGLLIKEVALEMLGPWSERVERLAVWRR